MLKALISKFHKDTNGSILPIFGLMVLLLVVIGGAAIDVSRAVNAREKLAYAIDAAALSVATDLSTSALSNAQIKQRLENSFRANLGDVDFLDQAIENLSFVVDSDAGTVTVSSSAALNNYFLNIPGFGKDALGPDAFNIGTNAQVNYSRFDVEVALVVDVTGSMDWPIGSTGKIRIDALKEASQAILDILIPADTTTSASKVRMSIVPYSQGVNVGSYSGLVTNDALNFRNCATERLGAAQFTDDPYDYDSQNLRSFFGGGSTSCSSSSVLQPLTSDRSILQTAIRNLDPSGGTAGQTGIAWGWYTLSPNWTNLWPADSHPEPYTNRETLKFAIIMTDGDNNSYYDYDGRTYGWYQDQSGNWRRGWYTCEGWCGFSEREIYENNSSQRSRSLCNAMTSAGIEVFGVYLGTNSSSLGARNMSACASSSDTYYMATSTEGLIQAFSNIAKRIQQIYLSQ